MDSSADRLPGLYEDNAQAWDRDRQDGRKEGERAWIARFSEAAGPGSSILDLGCGSGEPIAAELVDGGHRVTGVDSSPSLIALCRARMPQQQWIVADMRDLDLADRHDGILAWNSFFHLPIDAQRRMFPIFAKHLRSGGPLMFTSGTQHGETFGCWQGERLYHASLDTEEYRMLLRVHDFALIDHVPNDPTTGGLTIWLARRL